MFNERNEIYKYYCIRSQIICSIMYKARYQIKKDYFLVSRAYTHTRARTHRKCINKIIYLKTRNIHCVRGNVK